MDLEKSDRPIGWIWDVSELILKYERRYDLRSLAWVFCWQTNELLPHCAPVDKWANV